MQCAGNRRADMLRVRPVAGDPWGPGAIGNARWTGVRLADVLEAVGVHDDARLHVAFACRDACDVDGKQFHYEASIPMSKAMSQDVLLAYAMNGEPLAPEHGYPLRVVTPGYAGVRSPKWLCRIEVRDTPSDCPDPGRGLQAAPAGHYEHRRHRLAARRDDQRPSRQLRDLRAVGPREARGGGRPCCVVGRSRRSERSCASTCRSTAGGRGVRPTSRGSISTWSWTFWSLEVELPVGDHELVVRAWDAAGQTQPLVARRHLERKGLSEHVLASRARRGTLSRNRPLGAGGAAARFISRCNRLLSSAKERGLALRSNPEAP